MMSSARGIKLPRASDAMEHMEWLSMRYSDAWDYMVEAINEGGLKMDDIYFNPEQASKMMVVGMLRPEHYEAAEGYEFFDFNQWNPLESRYQTWGTLTSYELEWFVSLCRPFFSLN